MNRTTHHTAAARRAAARARALRAFTLLEVLLGVLILALGLLGLGALIPVVVRQQRTATDETLGVVVAGDARAYLEGRLDLNRARDIAYYTAAANPTEDYRKGWGRLCLPREAGTPTLADNDQATFDSWSRNYEWVDWTQPPLELSYTTGDLTIDGAQTPRDDVVIKMVDRLWPPRAATQAQPQFVWDFVARRVPTLPGEPYKLQIALFVRRLDPSIRVPQGNTLLDVLTGSNGVSAGQRRVPVAVDSSGLPTRNGDGEYAQPVILNAQLVNNGNVRDRIELTSGTNIQRRLAGQAGQKLVDNLGNVYTVTKTGADNASADTDILYIDPPVPEWVNASPSDAWFGLNQVVFTPQIPAAVEVFTVSPSDPEI